MPRFVSKAAVEADMHRRLTRHGVRGDGRVWLLRALHPASYQSKALEGLPDQSATPVFRVPFRVESTISPDPAVANWDCLMWLPPGDCNALYYVTAPAGTDFSSGTVPASGVTMGAINLQASIIQDVSGSEQFTATFPAVGVVNGLTSLPASNALGFRHLYKSVTVSLDASAVNDQGRVYAAQYSPMIREAGVLFPAGYNTGIPIPDSGNFYSYTVEQYNAVIPTAETDLTAMSPGFYEGLAREGVYMPLHLSGPTQPFARAIPAGMALFGSDGNEAGTLNGNRSGRSIGALLVPNSGAAPSAVRLPWPFYALADGSYSTEGAVAPSTFDSGYDNVNIGVIIWRGLAGSGGGGSFGAKLQVKVLAGIEMAPRPTAFERTLTVPAAAYDAKAIEAYYRIALDMPDAYPASFNSLEGMWDAIKDAASKIWDRVEPAIVDTVGGGLSSLVSMGGQALASRLGGRLGGSAPRLLYRAPSRAGSVARSVKVAPKRPARAARRGRAKAAK